MNILKTSPSVTEADVILASIFFEGYYEEEIKLPRNHCCVFKTPPLSVGREIFSLISADQPKTVSRYELLYATYCLAAFLISLDNKKLPPLITTNKESIIKSLKTKESVLDHLSGSVMDIFIVELAKFNQKIITAKETEKQKNEF